MTHLDASTRFLELSFDRGDGRLPFSYLGATSDKKDGYVAMEWGGANPAGKSPKVKRTQPR